jgi:hypothetical protein
MMPIKQYSTYQGSKKNYVSMAENDAPSYLEGPTNFISQQDGETPHICKVVLESLNANGWVDKGRFCTLSVHLIPPN